MRVSRVKSLRETQRREAGFRGFPPRCSCVGHAIRRRAAPCCVVDKRQRRSRQPRVRSGRWRFLSHGRIKGGRPTPPKSKHAVEHLVYGSRNSRCHTEDYAMQEYIVLPVLLAVARAGYVAPVTGFIETESSTSHHSQDVAGNYNFGYKEHHPSGATFRQETGNPWGHKVGSYGIADADGRYRLGQLPVLPELVSTLPWRCPRHPLWNPCFSSPPHHSELLAKAVPAVTAAHVYGPPIVGPILKPAAPLGGFRPVYAKKSYAPVVVQPGREVEYDARDDRHW
ncbi:hypothetical protein MRX96_004976 [Rhipicephalus microplus]